jgi:hypothetical protein
LWLSKVAKCGADSEKVFHSLVCFTRLSSTLFIAAKTLFSSRLNVSLLSFSYSSAAGSGFSPVM